MLRGEGPALFAAFSAVYLAVGALMVLHNVVFADALSRVANSFYVLYSRDPHLQAVGFVWNPLPSILILPLLPLKAVLPALATRGVAGDISSALFMAGAVALVASSLRRLGVGRGARVALALLFGIQPMILLYAGSGMSEPIMLFFLLLVTDSLIAWAQDARHGRLVTAGLALAMAYLTRYEAVGPAIAVTAFVGLVTLRRMSGARQHRAKVALNDMALVAAPFAFAVALWSLSAKILTGTWLPTSSSTYGNAAQVGANQSSIQAVTGSTLLQVADYALRQMVGLAPALLLFAWLCLLLVARRRPLAWLVPLTVLGSAVVTDNLLLLDGRSFGWLRFQMAVIPLSVLMAGILLVAMGGRRAERARSSARSRIGAPPRTLRRAAGGAVVALVALAVPVQARTVTSVSSNLAREEAPMLSAALSERGPGARSPALEKFTTEREISGYLDAMRLGAGSVLVDTSYGYSVVLASQAPTQFVISSDRDFHAALNDPMDHHVRYLLVVSKKAGLGDALSARWPHLYADGAGIAVLARQWRSTDLGTWRLYRVLGS